MTGSLFLFSQRPDSMGSDEGAEHLDAIQAAIQQGKPSQLHIQHLQNAFLSQMDTPLRGALVIFCKFFCKGWVLIAIVRLNQYPSDKELCLMVKSNSQILNLKYFNFFLYD